ncbi:zinc ribbon domain-containing protein [Acholeplasma laidlawii]|uniref:zinc ribbon domain-containing protein n=1 Tax=Acholeplasma laidlawii TaxID=2148 RepID=UPI0021F7A5AC|nr:zinc ribbon domain-containing protein [Acholeplasma laidlawii]
METKDVLKSIRDEAKLSQSQFANQLNVTRQAVSRWENGLATPNTTTLKQISIDFNISVNKLLGSPKPLICQCCGMPLDNDDVTISKELDGSYNELYCKWCYSDGEFIYKSLEQLVDFLVPHLSNMHKQDPKKIKEYVESYLPKLEMWKK